MKSITILSAGLTAALLCACGGGGEPAAAGAATTGGGEEASGGGAAATSGAGGAAEVGCPRTLPSFATEVVDVSWGPGQSFGRDRMPDVVLGPPMGGGCCQGSTDVVSLGNGGSIVLAFGSTRIVDGPGVDFVVFENPFEAADGGVFAELATVEVSSDGESWHAFPCRADDPPYDLCAGHEPVYLSGEEGTFDPESSGGDGFDLADLGVESAAFLRITDRPDLTGQAGVFDLDAVGLVHATCP